MRDKQIIVDKLCEKFNVPKIPVKFQKMEDMGDNYACFDNIEYVIYYGIDCKDVKMLHKFCHYLIHLLGKVNDAEEEICDAFMDDFMNESDIKKIFKEAKVNIPTNELI